MRRGRADGEYGRTKSRALPHEGVRYLRVINLAETRERLVGLGVHLGGKMLLHKCIGAHACAEECHTPVRASLGGGNVVGEDVERGGVPRAGNQLALSEVKVQAALGPVLSDD